MFSLNHLLQIKFILFWGGGHPQTSNCGQELCFSNSKSKISISATLKNKTIVSKSPMRQPHAQQIVLSTSYNSNSARAQMNNGSPLNNTKDLKSKIQMSSQSSRGVATGLSGSSISHHNEGAQQSSNNGIDLKSSINSQQQGGMRISRGAFDVNCSTTRDPAFLMAEIYKVLESNKIQYKQMNTYSLRCQRVDVKFEMELTQYEGADFIYIIKFRKNGQGLETQAYRDLCQKVLSSINL
eukprot:403332240